MKARNIILTITAAALIAAPGVLFAQQGPGGGGTCDGEGPHGPAGQGGPHGEGSFGSNAAHGLLRMLPRLAERLELSDAQKDQIHAIIDAQKPALEALKDQASAARDIFHDTYEVGDYDEAAFRMFFESQAQLHVEMQLIGAETVSQVWDILTPEQQEELLELMDLFRDGRGGPRNGGGKRMGPH